MKKFIILLLSFIFIVACLSYYYSDIRFFIYKQKHPGLMNYDFGILSMEDLDKADEDAFLTPFDGTNTGYPYWQCYNKKYLRLECDGDLFSLEIENPTAIHSYSLNHGISMDVCHELLSEIDRVLMNRTYFCISGTNDNIKKDAPKKEFSWSFHRLKTKSGYAHYFEEEQSYLNH